MIMAHNLTTDSLLNHRENHIVHTSQKHGISGDGTIAKTSTASSRPISVLFVCLGNICRSPMAEAVFRSVTASDQRLSHIDSCGTGAYRTYKYRRSKTSSCTIHADCVHRRGRLSRSTNHDHTTG